MNAPAESLKHIPLSSIVESPTNPRKRFDEAALRELAESIKSKGLIEPAIVRPLADGYELVVGARRFRASGLAGLSTLLCIVRDLTDREVAEVQLDENGQRADVHPLEEADAYQHLRTQGAEVAELAARTGKGVAYVEQRLRFVSLIPEAREAFLSEQLSAGIALLIARLTPERQVKALAAFTSPQQFSSAPWTVADAQRWIRREFHRQLGQAPFDPTDATLVPAAGACVGCAKNTATQGSLFSDFTAVAECTDGDCWKSKESERWARATAPAKAEGKKVLAPEEAASVLTMCGPPGKGYVRPSDKPADVSNGRRTWAEILKKSPPQVSVALSPRSGEVQELIAPADLKAAMKACKVERKKPENAAPARRTDDGMTWQERQDLKRKVSNELQRQVDDAATAKPLDDTFWPFLVRAVARACPDTTQGIAARRELKTDRTLIARRIDPTDAAIDALSEQLTSIAARGFIAETLVAAALVYDDTWGPDNELLTMVLGYYGVDPEETARRLREPKPAPEPAPAKTTGKSTGKSKKAAKDG